ncbi:MAG TPA: hypothetical protein EYQ40_01660 [Candidatus Marinimicrobia bacterium]|nr:hypothetical protein [Candidatus Neomarinimicrobiota bacterium]
MNCFLFSSSSKTFLETQIPPAGDMLSKRLAILTPSPKTSSPSKTISPTWMPIRIFKNSSSKVFACSFTAQVDASMADPK